MRTDLFDFELPPERIALRPASPRDSARMLVVQPDAVWRDRVVSDLPQWLEPGDQLVVNDTRVISAQLSGRRLGRADRAEDRGDPDQAPRRLALAGAGAGPRRSCRRAMWCASAMRAGSVCSAISTPRSSTRATMARSRCRSHFTDRRSTRPSPISVRRRCHPISPRSAQADERDAADYQTMFAVNEGAVAAPTAGLHFTPALEQALRDRGVGIHRITLHVGAGTFLPVKADDTAGHRMHAEWGVISGQTADALNAARARRRPDRRRRHHLAAASGKRHGGGRHDRAVRRRDRYLHHAGLPLSRGRYSPDQFSSAAFDAVHAGIGVQRPRDHEAAYAHAIASGYRFYSYGDACLLFRAKSGG